MRGFLFTVNFAARIHSPPGIGPTTQPLASGLHPVLCTPRLPLPVLRGGLMRKLLVCSFVLALLLVPSSLLTAQTVDTSILGSVTDPQGAAVPGATVMIRAEATGQEKTVTTTGDGQYRVQYLVPGTYSVTVTASGFAQAIRTGIQLALSQQIHLDVGLTLGTTQQSVEVTAGAA